MNQSLHNYYLSFVTVLLYEMLLLLLSRLHIGEYCRLHIHGYIYAAKEVCQSKSEERVA